MFTKFYLQPRRGAIAILTLLGVTIFGLLVMNSLATAATRESQMGLDDVNTTKTFYAAEAGLNIELYNMATGSSAPIPSLTDINELAVAHDLVGFNNIITSSARDKTGKVRKVEISLLTSTGGFTSAVQADEGGIIFASSGATINGQVFTGGDVNNESGSGSTINGGLTLFNGSTVTGGPVTINPGPLVNSSSELPPMPININNINKWKADITAYGNTTGSVTVSSSTSIGWQKINGNLTIDNNQILTMTGSIWVTGNVVLGNNSKIFISHALPESPSLVLLADGTVDASQNVTLCGSGCVDVITIDSSNGGNLTAGTTYFYKVSAVISGKETASWKQVSKATTNGKKTINLSWPSVAGASSYKIYRTIVSETYQTSSLIGTSSTPSFIDNGSAALVAGKPPINFLLVVSSNTSVNSSAPAIAASNNSDSAIFAAPFGMLDVKHGAINAGASYVIQMETNTTVNYRTELSTIFIPTNDEDLTVAPSSWKDK